MKIHTTEREGPRCPHGFLEQALCLSCTPWPSASPSREDLLADEFKEGNEHLLRQMVGLARELAPDRVLGRAVEALRQEPIVISPAEGVAMRELAKQIDGYGGPHAGGIVFIPKGADASSSAKAESAVNRTLAWGEWAAKNAEWIRIALRTMMGHQPRGRISPYERALDSIPDRFELVKYSCGQCRDTGQFREQLYDLAGRDNGVRITLCRCRDTTAGHVVAWPSHTKPTELEP